MFIQRVYLICLGLHEEDVQDVHFIYMFIDVVRQLWFQLLLKIFADDYRGFHPDTLD